MHFSRGVRIHRARCDRAALERIPAVNGSRLDEIHPARESKIALFDARFRNQ